MVNIYKKGDILCRIFKKNSNKLKMKSQERKNGFLVNLSKNIQKIYFLGPVTSNLPFFAVFSKMHLSISTLPVFNVF